MRVMKACRLDVRLAWEWERLYFLNSHRFSPTLKSWLLGAYCNLTPPGRGLAWGCAMESAYRIFNLSWYLHTEGDSLSPVQRRRFCQAIRREANFIQSNLERHSYNNHYAFNVFGLLLAYCVDAELDDEYWKGQLKDVLSRQFHADGTNFEASTRYHLLMVEALTRLVTIRKELQPLVLANLNMVGCLAFARRICVSARRSWMVGDNDGSMVVRNTSRLKIIMLASQTFESDKHLEPAPSTIRFPDFGVAFLRGENAEIALWNPLPGQSGKGGHNHNDCLAITLSVSGEPVVTDPGVFLYLVARNYYRSAAVHSTMLPGDLNPQRRPVVFASSILGSATYM